VRFFFFDNFRKREYVTYKPYLSRYPDYEYYNLLRTIVDQGIISPSPQGIDCLTYLNHTMRFELSNGFPMITQRSLKSFWRKPIAELLVFMRGGRTQEELEAAGCDWWSQWTSLEKTSKRGLPEGDIGPGSYGPAFHDFPMPNGETFDQISNLVQTIIDRPNDRRALVVPWIPYLVAKNTLVEPQVTIAPCHGTIYVRILGGQLHLTMVQRSGDVPVGVPSNMIQYAALTLMLAQVTGYPAASYSHHILDAHIYIDQLKYVDVLLRRAPKRLPTVQLSDEGKQIKDIFAFTPDHFVLSDYHPDQSIKGIPVAT
jgi:thymidylate synthase